MPPVSRSGFVPGAAACPLSPASRSAAYAPRSAAPPTVPAVPRPDRKERHTPTVTRSGAARQTAPETGGGGGDGAAQGSAHPAAAAGPKTTAPSASRAARRSEHSTADAMPPGVPPVAACDARNPRSEACRAAADASRWRRSASLPSGRAPSARGDMPLAAPEANVWIARRLSVAPPAVNAARTVPTPALPSVISCRCGRRRSP